MNKDKTTIDDLGQMVQKGFDGVNQRFDNVDKTLEKHAVMLIEHGERLDGIDGTLKDHTERLDRIEVKLDRAVYRKEFEELQNRVRALEQAIAIRREK